MQPACNFKKVINRLSVEQLKFLFSNAFQLQSTGTIVFDNSIQENCIYGNIV